VGSRLLLSLVLALLCLRPEHVSAWGPDGHHIVARIALLQMTPAAKQAAQELLGADDFVASSTWADQVRSARPETYNWHFVDIPVGQSQYDPARDCKATDRGDCIIAELQRAESQISNSALRKDPRKEALKFLIHLVGDLHQPLHAIDNADRGGNDVYVTLAGQPPPTRGSLNLHAVWDSSILSQRSVMNEDEYANALLRSAPPRSSADAPGDFVAWALESHRLAEERAYAYPGFVAGGPPTAVVTLDVAYQQKAQTVIAQQLTLAGRRLAETLNRAFAGR
jgi:hypothetical protein